MVEKAGGDVAAISFKNVRKVYPNGFEALKGVSFDVKQGEFFGLLGPNGAGKTTLISALAGLSAPTSGSAWVLGRDVRVDPDFTRRNLGVVTQELTYDPFFSVEETLRYQSGYFGLRDNKDWIDEVLANLGLDDKRKTNTRHLSGGMKRRLMVAQALVHRPPVIILDEPTAGVDVELRLSLWKFIGRLNKEGHTVVLTTHYLEEAEQNCDRVAMLKQGRIVALDKTESLMRDNDRAIGAELTLSAEAPESLRCKVIEEKGGNTYVLSFRDYGELGDAFNALKDAGVKIRNMRSLGQDLESVFVKLTSN